MEIGHVIVRLTTGFLADFSAHRGWITTSLGHDMFIDDLFNDATSKGKAKFHIRTGYEDPEGELEV